MSDVFNVTGATDEELSRYIDMMRKAHKLMEDKLVEHANKITAAQAELQAREFSAYWKAHPELTPLTVGDNLLVTQEYINLASGWEIPYLTPLIGSRCSVTNILRGNKYTWVCLDKKLHDAPISIASNMRAAYLAKYPESEANS